MNLRDVLRVPPGQGVDLDRLDPDSTPGLPEGQAKAWATGRLADIARDLASLQEKLYASAKSEAANARVLLVLQAMDCAGKDGTVKKVVGAMNPQGVQVTSFGKPTAVELEHDFLWRIRKALPTPGHVGVFNRSQYEDVLVARVHGTASSATCRARFGVINEFEKGLADDGVEIVKVMLHISRQEQARRLAARLDDPTKYWKYDPHDVCERDRWHEYLAAYADVLANCSTQWAPWYVVPANHKWYRNWAVATILADTMADMGIGYPPPTFDIDTERARLKAT